MDFFDGLVVEEVTDPHELTGVPDENLVVLKVGLKIGPKGLFAQKVRKMRAAEQVERGSTCGSTC